MAALNKPHKLNPDRSMLTPLPKNCNVGRWTVGQKEVIVSKENNSLFYSIKKEGVQEKKGLLPADTINLYGMRRAIEIIQNFQKVIQANLESWIDSKDSIGSQTFLPILCTDGFVQNESLKVLNTCIQVVLFGRVKPDGMGLKVIGARWGIFDPSKDEKVSFCEVSPLCPVVMEFAKKVREYRPVEINETHVKACKEHPEEDIDSGKRCVKLYEEHVSRFRAILSLNDAGKVSSIALRHVSKYDPDVLLSKEHWAITVISTALKATCGNVECEVGHAMIAYEGVRNAEVFLNYLHITQARSPEGEEKRSDKAWTEILPDRRLTISAKGPTWMRPKSSVERMIQPFEDAQQEIMCK